MLQYTVQFWMTTKASISRRRIRRTTTEFARLWLAHPDASHHSALCPRGHARAAEMNDREDKSEFQIVANQEKIQLDAPPAE